MIKTHGLSHVALAVADPDRTLAFYQAGEPSLGAMGELANIRRYRAGEEASLFDIYFTAIHLVASRDYTAEQIRAWAPANLDAALWKNKMREINPFVAELKCEIVGYADLQANGYIDHFFVSGKHPRAGIGSILMNRILAEAASLNLSSLTSHVSRTAQPFFAKFGFVVVEHLYPEVRGVVVPNALMRRNVR
jgi:putative acetyltransferase